MTTIFSESFETDGNGTRYDTSIPEFSDGTGDFFTRTDESNVGSFYDVNGQNGDFYFAAMDLDGEGDDGSQTLSITGIDITGYSNLAFKGLFAEDDDGSNQDWDADTSLIVKYSIDGGAMQTLLAFEAAGGTNTEPLLDTDFDGVGDGAALSATFAEFSAAIVGMGGTLDLLIEFNNLNAGDEDVALDDIAITGDLAVPLTPVLEESFETDGNGTRYTTSVVEFSDGSGDFFTRTDGSNTGSFYQVTGQDGAFYFAGMDLDGEGDDGSQTLTFAGLDISGRTGLQFSGLFAEDDDGSNQDWDADTSLIVKYSIDGGAMQTLLAFAAAGGTNTEPLLDTDFDGVGDGAALSATFAEFTADITGTGSTLDLVVEFNNLNAGDEDVAVDLLRITSDDGSGTLPTLSIDDVTVAEGDSGTTTATFTVTLSEEVSGGLSVDFATADGSAIAGSDYTTNSGTLVFAGTAGETQTITVDVTGDALVEGDEDFTVTLSDGGALNGAVISAVEGTGTATITNDDTGPVLISTIQGTGEASGMVGQTVTVEAIVVGDFQEGDADTSRDLRGFYLQEQDADADGNALTSEGIFVFDNLFGVDVAVGDLVQVTGTVSEFFGETQIGSITDVSVVSSGIPLPTAAEISLPAAATTLNQDGDLQPDLEAYEGMLVTFADTLTVTEMFQLDRFNEIKLVAGDRPYQFTQQNAPDVAGYTAFLEELGARTITYDDGLSQQNALIGNLDGFGDPFTTANAVSMGDTIDNLSGVLSYQWAGNSASQATWRVRATEDGENTFVDTNPREAAPEDVGGTLKVASLNVLNYFTTIDVSGATTSNGSDPRGADTTSEFNRQTEKLVTAISAMEADVIGLVEIENDFQPGSPGNAVENLVAALNAAGGTWDWVNPGTSFVGTDAIANALIYNTSKVQLAAGTTVEILDDSDLADLGITPEGAGIFDAARSNRAVVAATFEEIASGESFTAAVNHFKSKGSINEAPGNTAIGDGAGNNNAIRLEAAKALEAWLATDPTGSGDPDYMILGDLNAYAKEDPVQFLINAGYADLAQEFIGPDAYSYVFDGQVGTLDYAMANGNLFAQVTGTTEWHVNSDEADAIDYNEDFGRDTAIFDGSVPFRNSDHDPVIVGLNLGDVVDFNGDLLAVSSFSTRQDKGSSSDDMTGELTLSGNAWKSVVFNYELTENTVLTLEYNSDALGEVHGIGFANNGRATQEAFFNFAGVQNYGWENDAWAYEIGSGFQQLTIQLGEYIDGDFDSFVFVMDDDAGLGGEGTFRNISLTEDPGLRTIDINGEDYAVDAFSVRQDKGDLDISDVDGSLTLSNNAWKSVDIDLVIAAETKLAFDFKADVLGEIHGIGFAQDGTILQENVFNLAGGQRWGIEDAAWDYTGGGAFQAFEIAVGDYVTGTFDQLVFIMDDDGGVGADSTFNNISIFEDIVFT